MSDPVTNRQTVPMTARILAVVISVAISGLGLLALINGYEPGRLTTLGYTGPLFGGSARHFGAFVFLFGLTPLMLLAKTKRSAFWFGSSVMLLALINLFFGASLWV